MNAHKEDHKISKRTPVKCPTVNFKAFANKKNHSRVVAEKTEEIKVHFAKPLASQQNKTAISSSASLPNNVVEYIDLRIRVFATPKEEVSCSKPKKNKIQ